MADGREKCRIKKHICAAIEKSRGGAAPAGCAASFSPSGYSEKIRMARFTSSFIACMAAYSTSCR